jgi:hypothetical protein
MIKFVCEDSYEADKLSSIFSLQKDDSLFITEIVKVISNEVVVKLKDGSHHSILFKDHRNAQMLKDMFQDFSATSDKTISTFSINNETYIDLK